MKWTYVTLSAFFILITSVRIASAAQTCNNQFWITDNYVEAIVQYDDKLFLGGTFTQVGPNTGSFVIVDTAPGELRMTTPGLYGTTEVVCEDTKGGWYVAGNNQSIEGEKTGRIVHVLPDGSIDRTWKSPGLNGDVLCMVRSGPRLYVGGDFSYWEGDERLRNFMVLNAETGESLGWNLDLKLSDVISAVAVNGSTLYLGGEFSSIGDSSRHYLAAINAETGEITAFDAKINIFVGVYKINALAVNGSHLYVGGKLFELNEKKRRNIAVLDAVTGEVTDWDPSPNGEVNTISIKGTTVYVGGAFDSIGGKRRLYLAAIDAEMGNVTDWAPVANNVVYTSAIYKDDVYVGGAFDQIGVSWKKHLAAIDGTTGDVLTWSSHTSSDVTSIAVSGSKIGVGGKFNIMGGINAGYLAAIDTATGKAFDWELGADKSVNALAIKGSTIFAGGSFLTLCGEKRHHIGSFNSENGEATQWYPSISGTVYELQVSEETLFVGGDFDSVNGQEMRNFAAFDMRSGDLLNWNIGANRQVFAIAINGSVMYAGGAFDTIGGQPRSRIAAIDRETGKVLDWNPGANKTVRTIVANGSNVYIGGDFDTIAGKQRKFIAAVDNKTGEVTDWNPDADDPVNTILSNGKTLYVGGSFDSIGGQNRESLAALDSANGKVTNWSPHNIFCCIESIVLSGTKLYIGGRFDNINQCFGFSNYAILDINDTLVSTSQKNSRKINSTKLCNIKVTKYSNKLNIHFNNEVQSPIILALHDIQGKKLQTFHDRTLLPGAHVIPIDISRFAKGCYYVVLKAQRFQAVQRVVLW